MKSVQLYKDPKSEVKFWIDALSNENLTQESILLLNKALQNELYIYMHPLVYIKTK